MRHVRFKPRPLTGTIERLRTVAPETLILDGQQRLTSLYQALMSQAAVETKDAKNKPIRRWYYIDMKKAVEADADREDATTERPRGQAYEEPSAVRSLWMSPPWSVSTPRISSL